MTELPGYDAWKTRLPDWWDEEPSEEEQFNDAFDRFINEHSDPALDDKRLRKRRCWFFRRAYRQRDWKHPEGPIMTRQYRGYTLYLRQTEEGQWSYSHSGSGWAYGGYWNQMQAVQAAFMF